MMKHVLVTGSSRGIGAEIARSLASSARHIWVHYRHGKAAAQGVVDDIEGRGFHASLLSFDVSNRSASKAVLEKFVEEYGGFDIIVNNAGITRDAPFPGMTDEQWDDVLQTCLGAFYNVNRPLIMPMIRKRWGRIVNMASVAALHGNRGQSNYAAAKAGVIAASQSLAKEVASRGITVNAVAPGFIDTEMTEHIAQEHVKQVVPMGRAGRTEEVAAAVKFLCSDAASYITGEVINVSGGIG